ncbi:MAG: hypothetical protein V3R84_01310 [Acidimicrobiia bacterium]
MALLASSCGISTLGRAFPRCEFPFVDIPVSVIMEIQAIPDAEFGPCINELEPGWTYHHMQHQSGNVRFFIDSDRLGDRFLTVNLSESCDPGSAAARAHPNNRITRFVEATEEIQPIDLVIVPTSDSAREYAARVGVDLAGQSVRGRPLTLQLADSKTPDEDIGEALEDGAFVVIVSANDAARETMQGMAPGDDEIHTNLTLGDVLDGIEERVEEGTYRATWFHLFDGGCVTFEFDADGAGVETLVADVELAVGFADLADLKEQAKQAGFILDPSDL